VYEFAYHCAKLAFLKGGTLDDTGLNLFDIKCAWFNENEYCEFFPRTLLSRAQRRPAAWSIDRPT
jgi:hypothetical protein